MEGLGKAFKDLRMSGILPKIWTRHLENTSLDHQTAQTLLVYNTNELIFGVYTKKKFGELKVNICTFEQAIILHNPNVAVSKLSHMPCFVQTPFSEWVWTVTHHEKWNVFLLLTVLCDIASSFIIMQCMLLCSVILWRNV